jgi:hypothetical protein
MQKYLSNKNELCLQEEIQSISKSTCLSMQQEISALVNISLSQMIESISMCSLPLWINLQHNTIVIVD